MERPPLNFKRSINSLSFFVDSFLELKKSVTSSIDLMLIRLVSLSLSASDIFSVLKYLFIKYASLSSISIFFDFESIAIS